MAFIEIRTYPDPVLRKIASPVKEISDELLKLSQDMIETMRLWHGAGLAANQVGEPIRLIVLEIPQQNKEGKPIIVFNPVIVEQASEDIIEEGCLSVPKYYEFVKRAKKVLVKGIDLKGEAFEMECEGHLARAFQHEIDHLNGILFIDHLSPVKRNIFKKRFSKSGK